MVDNQFNIITTNGTSSAIQVIAGSSKQALVAPTLTMPKNGYLYVYVSNESPQDVYFDDVTVQHQAGPLVQEQSYYPFGLPMAAISDKAALKPNTPYKYNAGAELEEEGIDYYNTFYRKYDAQIGRFTGVDMYADMYADVNPYQYAVNNPIMFNDPNGDQIPAPGRYKPWVTRNGKTNIDYIDAFLHPQDEVFGGDAFFGGGGGSGGGGGDYSEFWGNYLSNTDNLEHREGEGWYQKRNETWFGYNGDNGYSWIKPTYSGERYLSYDGWATFTGITIREIWEAYIAPAESKSVDKSSFWGWVQTGLDILGSTEIPILSQIGDIASGVISLAQGDYKGALLSLGGAFIPGLSQVKLARNVFKHADEAVDGAYQVYHLINKNTKAVEYVGITKRGTDIRFAEHLLDKKKADWIGDVRPIIMNNGLTKREARIAEQNFINQFKLDNLRNINNSIAPKNWGSFGINPF